MMSKLIGVALIAGFASLPHHPAEADSLLDRLKRKAENARQETRELRNDVDAVTNVDERVAGEVDRAVPNEAAIERRAAASVEDTSAVQNVREAESDTRRAATTDERAQAAAVGERRALENEVDRATDVEGRARTEAGRTEAARTVRATQQDVHAVTTVDERAESEVQRQRNELKNALEE